MFTKINVTNSIVLVLDSKENITRSGKPYYLVIKEERKLGKIWLFPLKLDIEDALSEIEQEKIKEIAEKYRFDLAYAYMKKSRFMS